jgi:hypothetical protein
MLSKVLSKFKSTYRAYSEVIKFTDGLAYWTNGFTMVRTKSGLPDDYQGVKILDSVQTALKLKPQEQVEYLKDSMVQYPNVTIIENQEYTHLFTISQDTLVLLAKVTNGKELKLSMSKDRMLRADDTNGTTVFFGTMNEK